MERSPYPRRTGPALVVLAASAALVLGAAVPGAPPDVAWDPPACRDGAAGTGPRAAADRAVHDPAAGAWYRLDAELDAAGSLRGQRLRAGDRHGRWPGPVMLPPEAFTAGPYGPVILVGADDGTVSTLAFVDVAAACRIEIARETEVVRRAVLDPAGGSVVEMRVDRENRTDLGVWRRPLDGSPPFRILAPLAPDGRFGRTFATELSWSDDGRLVVASCGEVACRTRVVGPDGSVSTVADPGIGDILGVAGGRLVAYAACRGLPCPIVSVDLASGRRVELAREAGPAVLVAGQGGPVVAHETVPGPGAELRVVALDGRERGRHRALAGGLRLVPGPARSRGSLALPPGWLVLAPDGRVPAADDPSARARHIADGRAVVLAEASR